MAQKPVANALTLELEPVVEENLSPHRHRGTLVRPRLRAVRPGRELRLPRGQGLGSVVGDAAEGRSPTPCEILLITKDNLAGFHRELVEHFILDEKWGRWIGRWTAEEHLHAVALRNYLVVTREIDPTANEDVRVEHVMKGYRADSYSQVETLAFMAINERAHAVFTPQPAGADRRARAEEDGRPDRQGRGAPRGVLRQPRRPLPDHPARRDDRRDRHPGGDPRADRHRHRRLRRQGRVVAEAGIFDAAALRKVVADRIADWGVADAPDWPQFVSE